MTGVVVEVKLIRQSKKTKRYVVYVVGKVWQNWVMFASVVEKLCLLRLYS